MLSQANDFGAQITGLDLSEDLSQDVVDEIRCYWLKYQVLAFADQPLTHAQLERFTRYFGKHGNDPYVKAIDGHQHILEVRREPNEQPAPFGTSWHSDWSFQQSPPSATILHSKTIPPQGGNTHFADGFRAYDALDESFAKELSCLIAIHSARRSYSHESYERGGGQARSMTILPSKSAWDTQEHPLIRTHPESGRKALWINPVYTIAVKNLSEQASDRLLEKLFTHALDNAYIYKHQWSENMLTMWDNRSVQHCAQGGYDGFRRVLHRTVVAGSIPA